MMELALKDSMCNDKDISLSPVLAKPNSDVPNSSLDVPRDAQLLLILRLQEQNFSPMPLGETPTFQEGLIFRVLACRVRVLVFSCRSWRVMKTALS